MLLDVQKAVASMCACWLLVCGAWNAASAPPAYRFEVWNTERGLPQNTVLSIVQSRDGYLWVGTRFGLSRFDGFRFTTFNVANTPGMPCENCCALAEDAEGSLWIGTNEGLMRRRNNRFELFTTEHDLPHNGVRRVIAGREGGIWAGTTRGLGRFLDGRFTNLAHIVGSTTIRTEVFEDRSGSIWYNSSSGLFRLPPRAGPPELIAPTGHQAGERAHFFLEDAQSRVWFGNYAGLFRYSSNRVEHFPPRNLPGVGTQHPTLMGAAFQTEAGELYVAISEKGVLHRFENGAFMPVAGPGGKLIEYVNAGLEDREGNLWIGTQFQGLIAAQRGVIAVISAREGLPHENVLTVSPARDDSVWAGTSEGFVSRVNNRVAESFSLPGASVSDICSVLQDKSGTVWLGTRKGKRERSLFRLRDGKVENFNAQAGIASDTVSAIHEDRAGHLWFGTAEGVYRFKDGQHTRFGIEHGLAHTNVRAVLEDRQGRMWFGTYGGGVSVLHKGKFTTIDTKDGLTSNHAWAFHEDTDGHIWIGTESGLNRYNAGALFAFTRKHGLFDDLVNCILEDDLGNFWISCNRGIYRVSRQELNDVASGRASAVRHIAYGVSDGMLSSETNGENQPAGCKGRDGRLWFPTIQGLACIDPNHAQDNAVEPTVVIEQVTADNEVMLGNGLTVPAEQRSAAGKDFKLGARRGQVLQINYTANSFIGADRVRFKYRLDGHDRDWRDAGTDRVAYYTNLRPGDYRFRVLAANSHDRWNNAGAAVAFSIAPHFTQTTEFWLVVALLIAALIFAAHALRLRFVRRLERAEQFQAVEMERKRIAKDMHDDLGSSLTQISLLTELAARDAKQPEEFRNHLQRIGETTRGVFYSLDEIIWSTNPKNDVLESLLSFIAKYAQDFLRLAGVACRLDFPPSLPALPVSATLRHDLFLVVKEALNNIVRHSGATEVWLRATWTFPDLELTISDNGRGLRSGNGNGNHNGDGLINMRQRLQANGGDLTFESLPTNGTSLRMIIPVKARTSDQPTNQ